MGIQRMQGGHAPLAASGGTAAQGAQGAQAADTIVDEDTIATGGTAVVEDTIASEDTLDLRDRLDPVRTLLRRTAGGDEAARTALVEVLGPRIHGLALHLTESARRAERATIEVLRSCIGDAAALAAGPLPGETAVLDRARRMITPARGTGAVRSLVTRGEADRDRTRDRREVELVRVLLELDADSRVVFEAAAQGRLPPAEPERGAAQERIAAVLDRIVPFGSGAEPPLRALAATDALALATESERAQLHALLVDVEAASCHRAAIEAAARLTVLTSTEPARDLRAAVLVSPSTIPNAQPGAGAPSPRAAQEGHGAGSARGPVATTPSARSAGTPTPPAAPVPPAPVAPATPAAPEASYRGTYATPVLGTDTQRRVVGPPAMIGSAPGSANAPLEPELEQPSPPIPAPGAQQPGAAPAFAFRAADEAQRSRRERRRRRNERRGARASRAPWISRILAVLLAIALIGAGWQWRIERQQARAAAELVATWAQLDASSGSTAVEGVSDNGSWRAVLSPQGYALLAEGVEPYDEEVLQLWGHRGEETIDLGVIRPGRDGVIRVSGDAAVDGLTVTREHEPRNQSGTPSPRTVATLDAAGGSVG